MRSRPSTHGAHGAGDADSASPTDPSPVDLPPAPRHPQDDERLTPLARMALARVRVRAAVPVDVVTFVAACPACGADCEWTQEREETRVRSSQDCACSSATGAP